MNTEDSEFARIEHEALLRAAQPEVCHCDSKEWCEMYSTCHRKTCGFPPAQPVQPVKEIMQMALDALEEHEYARTDKSLRLGHAAIIALREALAQLAQPLPQGQNTDAEKVAFAAGMSCRPASVQRPRTWVGLTGEELRNIAREFKGNTQRRFEDHWDEIVALIREAEAKLKDKNT